MKRLEQKVAKATYCKSELKIDLKYCNVVYLEIIISNRLPESLGHSWEQTVRP